jgi:hypothetical protein
MQCCRTVPSRPRAGVTRVLGQAGARWTFEIQVTVEPGPGELLALVTDGCHELPRLRPIASQAVQGRLDLADAAHSLLESLCHERGHDDATAILMRDSACPPSVREEAQQALAAGKKLTDSGICGHLLIPVVVDEMVRGAGASDTAAVLRGLEALMAAGLRPRRQDAMRVVEAFVDDGQPDTLRGAPAAGGLGQKAVGRSARRGMQPGRS